MCGECGYVFFEMPAPRRLPRPSRGWTAAGLVALAAVVAVVFMLTREPPPAPAAPVPAARAELRLERWLAADPASSVHCFGEVREERLTRCRFVYPDGGDQPMRITLTPHGRLRIEQPSYSQRKPWP